MEEYHLCRNRLTVIFKNFILNNWEILKDGDEYKIKSRLTYTANYTWTNGPGLHFDNSPNIGSSIYTTKGGCNHVSG